MESGEGGIKSKRAVSVGYLTETFCRDGVSLFDYGRLSFHREPEKGANCRYRICAQLYSYRKVERDVERKFLIFSLKLESELVATAF